MMKKSAGFSLIEVLITLVLTTIGILGMVALQGRSIHYIQDATNRNTAHALSNELVEILRTNREELLNGSNKNLIFTSFNSTSLFFKKKSEGFKSSPVSAIATTDCAEQSNSALGKRNCWISQARQRLPGVTDLFNQHFYICQSSTPGNCDDRGSMIEIQLAWQVSEGACMDADAPNPTTCIMRTRVEL